MSCVQVKRTVEVVLDFPNLGKRIKEARERDDRSLAQICRDSGISRAYWYQLENEDMRSPATEEIIRKIEQVLGVDFGVKFNESGIGVSGLPEPDVPGLPEPNEVMKPLDETTDL